MPLYQIAIPTYNRVNEVKNKTLATLKRYNIDTSAIYLFVANDEQKKLYEEGVPKDLYGEIIVGVIGIAAQRNFIRHFFQEGDYIISMDDDITDIVFSNSKEKFQPVKTLDGLFMEAHDALLAKRLYIWGLYPVGNEHFTYERITTDLRFIIGIMYGYINRHSVDLDVCVNIDGKEDYENTILYYMKDGGVMRFNNIYPKQKFKAAGGIGAIRKSDESIAYLKHKYPQYVATKTRKSGIVEVRLKMPKKKE